MTKNTVVYTVIGCANYEGGEPESIRVFLNHDDAVTYGESLIAVKENLGGLPGWQEYDFYEINEVEMQ